MWNLVYIFKYMSNVPNCFYYECIPNGDFNNLNILVEVVFIIIIFSFKKHNCEYQTPALLVPAIFCCCCI